MPFVLSYPHTFVSSVLPLSMSCVGACIASVKTNVLFMTWTRNLVCNLYRLHLDRRGAGVRVNRHVLHRAIEGSVRGNWPQCALLVNDNNCATDTTGRPRTGSEHLTAAAGCVI